MANVKEHCANKGGEQANKQGPLRCHCTAAVDADWVRVNGVRCRAVIDDQADGYYYADNKDEYAKFFHCKAGNNFDAVIWR